MTRALLLALVFALLGAGGMALRVFLHAEPLNDRTLTLLFMAGASGALAAGLAAPLVRGRQGWHARAGAGFLFALLFMAGMTLSYVLHFEFVLQQTEWHDAWGRLSSLYDVARVAAQFLASSPTYLLPWLLPLLSLLAALILPGLPRRNG